MSTLQDRLAAALRMDAVVLHYAKRDWQHVGEFDVCKEPICAERRVLLAEYDASQEACNCEHAPSGESYAHNGSDFAAHPHTRAHCQPAEPAL